MAEEIIYRIPIKGYIKNEEEKKLDSSDSTTLENFRSKHKELITIVDKAPERYGDFLALVNGDRFKYMNDYGNLLEISDEEAYREALRCTNGLYHVFEIERRVQKNIMQTAFCPESVKKLGSWTCKCGTIHSSTVTGCIFCGPRKK